LEAENLQGRVLVTGNTVIDALQMSVARIESDAALRAQLDASLPPLDPRRKLLLVTGHRRENFGAGFAQICSALGRLARRDDLQIVYPVHLNPNVREPVMRELSGLQHLHLIEPLDYFQFVRLMQQAHVILTDSGGVQEEAPALGKPVLVMRDVTERPEAVAAGTVQLVGTDVGRIVDTVATLQTEEHLWKSFARKHNPYGDGRACGRIVDAILGREVQAFVA
jgi:UDP-N-acetylglucosamine 2-epimerase (non-hydrolysing)